jgi:putative membrane protein
MTAGRRPPAAFRLDEDSPAPRRPAGRKPSAMAAPRIRIEPEDIPEPLVAGGPEPVQVGRAMRWGSLLVSALFGLVALWAGLAATRLVEDLFARSPSARLDRCRADGAAGLAALMFIVREIVGLMRLSRLGTVREDAARALVNADADAAQTTIAALRRIYHGRRDVAWALGG